MSSFKIIFGYYSLNKPTNGAVCGSKTNTIISKLKKKSNASCRKGVLMAQSRTTCLLLVICYKIVLLAKKLLTFCRCSLCSRLSSNNYSHCIWSQPSQIMPVKAFVWVMKQNECCVTGPCGFQRCLTMRDSETKVAVCHETAVIWDKNTLLWFCFAFFLSVCCYCDSHLLNHSSLYATKWLQQRYMKFGCFHNFSGNTGVPTSVYLLFHLFARQHVVLQAGQATLCS